MVTLLLLEDHAATRLDFFQFPYSSKNQLFGDLALQLLCPLLLVAMRFIHKWSTRACKYDYNLSGTY
jgi:hypothetical protein